MKIILLLDDILEKKINCDDIFMLTRNIIKCFVNIVRWSTLIFVTNAADVKTVIYDNRLFFFISKLNVIIDY